MKATAMLLFSLLFSLQSLAKPIPRNEKLTISLLPFFSSAAVFIAKEKGYFHDENLDVDLQYAIAAQNVALSVAAEEANIGVTALSAGFYNLAGKGQLKILAGQYQEKKGWNGATFIACNSAYENGLTSPEQTPNHKMGISQTGSTYHRWYGSLANSLGKPLQDSQMIRLQSAPTMIAALVSCQVDSIIIMSHIADKLSNEKKAHIIGRVADYIPGQMGIVFSSTSATKNNPDKLKRFLRAYRRASEFYYQTLITQENTQERKDLLNLINQYLSPKVPDTILPKAVVYLAPDAEPDTASMKDNLNWYQKQGLVNQSVSIDKIVNLDLLHLAGSSKP